MDLTVKYSNKIAERFHRSSLTNAAAGHDYDFTGAQSVKVYSMVSADLVDYQRGSTRFGEVTDLNYTTQEMLCTQAKAFTKHLDALDSSDMSVESAAGKFLRMQVDEVIAPTMDRYRLKKWLMGGATLKQMDAEPTKDTIVGDIMALKGAMGDNLVPDTNLTLYIKTPYFVLLKQAQAVVGLEGMGSKAVEKGLVGLFDGMKVVPVPASWLPEGAYFLIKAKGATADPVKLAQYDVIPKAVGYSGPVVQGLCYYDSFVIGAKNVGIGVAGSAQCVLNAPVLSIASHKVTAAAVDGVTFYVTVDGSDPRSSTSRTELTAEGIVLTAGQTARCVGEKDGCVSLEAKQAYK